MNGAVDINPSTNIAGNIAPRAIGYRLTIGTSPGGNDLLNNSDQGNTLNYNPGTRTSSQHNYLCTNNSLQPCWRCHWLARNISFTTSEIAVLPGCTSMISPANGATNVPLTPILGMGAVPGATGYRITVG